MDSHRITLVKEREKNTTMNTYAGTKLMFWRIKMIKGSKIKSKQLISISSDSGNLSNSLKNFDIKGSKEKSGR